MKKKLKEKYSKSGYIPGIYYEKGYQIIIHPSSNGKEVIKMVTVTKIL